MTEKQKEIAMCVGIGLSLAYAFASQIIEETLRNF